jgi:dolichyl-phosphate-mannose--protein O-mannosyl transferase
LSKGCLKEKLAGVAQKLGKYKLMLIGVIVLYTILSFYNLGNFVSPRTFSKIKNDEFVVFEVLDEYKVPTKINMFVGYDNVYLYTFLADNYSGDESVFVNDETVTTEYDDVLTWQKKDFNKEKTKTKYIMLKSYWDSTSIGELVFLDDDDSIVETKLIKGSKGVALVDEPETIQLESNYMNSSYFDEVYFPRAVHEIFSNDYIFENTHPPLGKIIMYIPISIFGMSPFTYRFMGNVAGIIMILAMFWVGKEFFNDEKYGLFAAIIMALDGMHFAQTRIGTVDSFLALFCILAFLFFLKYLKIQDNAEYKKRNLMLAISGLFWGCAVSTKWNTAFVGVALGVLFFIDYFENKKMFVDKKLNYKPLLAGAFSFVLIPVVIYLASYLPVYWNSNETASYSYINEFGDTESETVSPDTIDGFIKYQIAMYQYHANLGPDHNEDYTEHPFSSKWYTWPVSIRPMWFYVDSYDDGTKSTIASMANPAIWWLSCITFVYTFVYTIVKKDKNGFILLVMALITWLSYARITRDMYIYHYFIVLPYMMLTIVFMMSKLVNWKPKLKKLIPILCVVFLLTFMYFYPVYSGARVSSRYIDSTKWLSTWVY